MRALAAAWMALTVGVAGWSQDQSPLAFNGGYTLGFSAAQLRGDGIEGFNKLGLYGGAVVDIRRFQNLGFQLGILYHEKGSKKVANPRTGDHSTWAYKFSYIDIPLVAVWSNCRKASPSAQACNQACSSARWKMGWTGEASREIGWTRICPSDPGN